MRQRVSPILAILCAVLALSPPGGRHIIAGEGAMISERTRRAMKWAAGGLLGLGLTVLTARAAEAAP